MSERIHFIVARSRNGWAVNVEADLLSEHADVGAARAQATRLAEWARQSGWPVSFVDLSQDGDDDV